MFDQMKTVGALASLMKDKDRVRQIGEEVRHTLAETRVEGTAGGGAVRVTASAEMRIIHVELAPAVCSALASDADRLSIQELITEATNDALAKARQAAHRVVTAKTQELGIPELPGLESFLP